MVMKVTVDRVMSDWPLNQIDPNNNKNKKQKDKKEEICCNQTTSWKFDFDFLLYLNYLYSQFIDYTTCFNAIYQL